MHVMMDHVEDIFLIRGQHIKSYILVINGQELLRMLPNMLKNAIVSKEWVDLRHLIKSLLCISYLTNSVMIHIVFGILIQTWIFMNYSFKRLLDKTHFHYHIFSHPYFLPMDY